MNIITMQVDLWPKPAGGECPYNGNYRAAASHIWYLYLLNIQVCSKLQQLLPWNAEELCIKVGSHYVPSNVVRRLNGNIQLLEGRYDEWTRNKFMGRLIRMITYFIIIHIILEYICTSI